MTLPDCAEVPALAPVGLEAPTEGIAEGLFAVVAGGGLVTAEGGLVATESGLVAADGVPAVCLLADLAVVACTLAVPWGVEVGSFPGGVILADDLQGFPAGVQVAALKSFAQAPPAWVVVVAEPLGSPGVTLDIREAS